MQNYVSKILKVYLVRRFGGYILFGGLAFATDTLVFMLIYNLTEKVLLANFTSAAFGMAVSFTGNLLFNFKKSNQKKVRLIKFVSVALTGFVATTNLILFLIGLGCPVILAKIFSLFVVVPIQFLANAKFTFR